MREIEENYEIVLNSKRRVLFVCSLDDFKYYVNVYLVTVVKGNKDVKTSKKKAGLRGPISSGSFDSREIISNTFLDLDSALDFMDKTKMEIIEVLTPVPDEKPSVLYSGLVVDLVIGNYLYKNSNKVGAVFDIRPDTEFRCIRQGANYTPVRVETLNNTMKSLKLPFVFANIVLPNGSEAYNLVLSSKVVKERQFLISYLRSVGYKITVL